MSAIQFHPARYYRLVEKATSDEQVWDILDNTKLNMAQKSQVFQTYKISQSIKESTELAKSAHCLNQRLVGVSETLTRS